MITRVEATNYRCFARLDVELGAFNVLVGANGSGKTTLLDIPVLLGDLMRARTIGGAFVERREGRAPRASGLDELVHRGRGDWFVLALEAAMPATIASQIASPRGLTHLRYEVRFQVFNGDLRVVGEHLFAFPAEKPPTRADEGGPRVHGEHAPRREWRTILQRAYEDDASYLPETDPKAKAKAREAKVSPQQLALPAVQYGALGVFPAARWFLTFLTEEAVFFAPAWDALRTASPPGLPPRVIPSAQNAPWLALALRKSDPDGFERWKAHVSAALPHVTNVEVKEREEDHHAYFKVAWRGGYDVTSSGLSDGTLRILVLTLLAYLPRVPRYLVAEQPEDGIHPRAIEAAMQAFEAVGDGQVIVSSHSPVVLARTTLDALLVARVAPDGAVQVVTGRKHPRLAGWKNHADLADFFAAGVLE